MSGKLLDSQSALKIIKTDDRLLDARPDLLSVCHGQPLFVFGCPCDLPLGLRTGLAEVRTGSQRQTTAARGTLLYRHATQNIARAFLFPSG